MWRRFLDQMNNDTGAAIFSIAIVSIIAFVVSCFIAMFIEDMYINIRKKHPSRMFFCIITLVFTLIITSAVMLFLIQK